LGNYIAPASDVELTPKKYIDDNFLDKQTGGSVNGPLDVMETLKVNSNLHPVFSMEALNGTGEWNRIHMQVSQDSGVFTIATARTDDTQFRHAININPTDAITTIHQELRLPANIGATNPKQPL
jgi:hypothetical protein